MPRGKPNVNKPLLDYLTEMVPDQSEKMQHVVKKAIRGLRAHPTKVCTKQEALKVYGVGEWVATRLETFMINNSHLFRPSTTILNSFQPPNAQQSQQPQQQEQPQQNQHLSTANNRSRATSSHPPSTAELLTEEEIYGSPNPSQTNSRRVSRGRGRGRGRGKGNASAASSVHDHLLNSTHEEFQLGTLSIPEQYPDDDFESSFQFGAAGTAGGRGRARGRGRGRGCGASSHRDDYHGEEEPWGVDTSAVKAVDIAATVRQERELNQLSPANKVARHDGLRFASRSGIQRNGSQHGIGDQPSTVSNLQSRQADSNAELAQMFLEQSAIRLHNIYDCGKEFGDGFPKLSQSHAQRRRYSASGHQTDFISPTNPSADKTEEQSPELAEPVAQKPQKRFTEAQVERSVRVIKQLSVFKEEDCLAELATVFEAGGFPRTDDKLYEVLSNRLWERQQSTQRTERSPRFTAARVNALARSICGGRSSNLLDEDFEESDDEIRPVPSCSAVPIHNSALPRVMGTPLKQRKAQNNVKQKQTEIIIIDDSDDDSRCRQL